MENTDLDTKESMPEKKIHGPRPPAVYMPVGKKSINEIIPQVPMNSHMHLCRVLFEMK